MIHRHYILNISVSKMNKIHAKQVGEKYLDRYMKADGETINGLLNESELFFEVYNDVEYQVRVNALKDSKERIMVVIAVDDKYSWSTIVPLTVSDFRVKGDLFWTTGTRIISTPEEKGLDRYHYANIGLETVSNVTPSCAFRVLRYLEKTLGTMNDRVVYAAGYTYKRKHDIKRVEDTFPVNVRINKSIKTGLYHLIPYRVDRFFLIKINRPECLVQIFHELDKFLSIRYGIFNKKSEKDFLHAMNNEHSMSFDGEKFILGYMKNDDEHVGYKINTGGHREDACFLEYVSYGKNAPKELIDFHLKSEGVNAI